MDSRPTLDAPDDDPYLWLEEVTGERALAWIRDQSAATLKRFGGPGFARDRDALVEVLSRPDNIPLISRRGQWVYNFWQDAEHRRGLWRRTTLASYREAAPAWQVLLDLDALAADEGEDWVWAGARVEPGPRERAIVRLSHGGGDAVVHREFDIATLSFLANGFALPEDKADVAWLDRDTLLLSSTLGDGMATRSGYPRAVRLWPRGTDPLAAPVLFEVDAGSIVAWGQVDRTAGAERFWFIEKATFFETVGWLGDRDGPKQHVELPRDAWWNVFGDWLAVKPRTPWTVAGTTHGADSLLGISLSAFLSGSRDFVTLFEPGPRRVPKSHFWNAGRLVLTVLDNLAPGIRVLTPDRSSWTCQLVETLPTTGVTTVWSLDDEEHETNGEVLVSLQDPLTPPTLGLLNVAQGTSVAAPQVLKRNPEAFDASGLVVTRHEAVSVDGEMIPYTQVGPPGESGEAPVHLSGYGGFAVPVEPVYRAGIGKLWLERGGTSVIAHIRGGGEFGAAWHEAGRRKGKRLTHDDFAAVAADLVRRDVTRPGRIAAEGGSNGGLLIANMLTRYPERFGALFCTIPLVDMRRYAKLLAGASWIDEYGDPDEPADWAFLRDISAYHAVAAGRPYPPILLATTRKDDRVHPGHARKLAAKLQALGYPAYFYEPGAGGHGYGKDMTEQAAFVALGYAFLRDAIGWEPADVDPNPVGFRK